jgi:glucose/arabinose dehydrogenase
MSRCTPDDPKVPCWAAAFGPRRWLAYLAAVAASFLIAGRMDFGLADEPPYDCRFTEQTITIDGRCDEPAWQGAVVIDRFTQPWLGADEPAASAATQARLLWDREFLYLAADMDDADLYADITEHDGDTWNNDVFELFLKPDIDEAGYYEFQVTPNNTRFDLFLPRRGHVRRFRRAREFHVESAVTVRGTLDRWDDRDQGWTVEMRIPWSDLVPTGGRPEPGATWRFALCRYDYDIARESPELSTTAALATDGKPDFHRHERYNAIRFGGPDERADAKPYGIPRFIPVTTSRVRGAPETPPYTVERTLPLARLSCPITVVHQPGTDLLLYVTEPDNYLPSKVMRMRDTPDAFMPETLIEVDHPERRLGTLHTAIVFHPRFLDNGYVYIATNGPCQPGAIEQVSRVTRYVIDREPPYRFHQETAKVIVEWDSDGHNGGDMAFGPDGMLYVTSGDGTSDSDKDLAGQDLARLRSKVLRIDVDIPDDRSKEGHAYAVPADNPFVDQPGIRPETWAYGFRNPWRIFIDQPTGQVWVANNGQDLWEQIYLVERGANYGWSLMEGGHPFDLSRSQGPHPISKPVADHSHAEARSMTGGLVYRGRALPELEGCYLYGDFLTGRIWALRHDGERVIRHDLLADTELRITSFALDSRGELLITDHQTDERGGFYRLVRRPPSVPRPFPRRLSESGLFASIREHAMAPGVLPYAVNSPLWSDGTHKVRFLALPATTDSEGRPTPQPIDVTNSNGWSFPNGTVFVKSFAIDALDGDPSARRWIETRFMLKEGGKWAGYSYEWNDDQTDAELVDAEGKDRDYPLRPAGAEHERPAAFAGGPTVLRWRYPSRTECLVCHSRASNFVLGFCTVQLNRDFDYAAALGAGHTIDNQLRTLEHLGMVRSNWWEDALEQATDRAPPRPADESRGAREARRRQIAARWAAPITLTATASLPASRSRLLTRSPENTNRLVDPRDPTADIASRARSYLHSNCGSCHQRSGGGNAMISLLFRDAFLEHPLAEQRLLGERPMHHTFGFPDACIVAPGDPARSVLYQRIARRGPGQMPQLATNVIDEQGVAVVREWIELLGKPAVP